MSVGKRIAEERKRTGLSQAVFAERVGVSFSSQRRYEDGRSSPDTTYLAALREAGVDVAYILGQNSGQRIDSAAPGDERAATGVSNIIAAYVELISQIGQRIGSRQDATDRLANFSANFSPVFWDGRSVPAPVVDAFFEGCSLEVDCDLLTAILGGLDASLVARGESLSASKKARVVAMLYRSFKASGKVDPAMIEEAIKLAAG